MMKDFLCRGIIEELNIRFAYALTTEAVTTAILRHQADPAAGHILGRALTTGVLCAPLLEGLEQYSFVWDYEGAVRKVAVSINAEGGVRGFTGAKALMDKVSTPAEIYGESGHLSVVKSNEKGILNRSTIEANILDVVDDLTFYFCVSEQVETDIYAAVGFNADPENPVQVSHGFLLQALPGCDYEKMEILRNYMRQPEFKALMEKPPQTDNYFEVLLQKLISHLDEKVTYTLYDSIEPKFFCPCNKGKVINGVKMLGKEELQQTIDKGESLNVACQYCSEKYQVTPEDLKKLI